LCGCNCVCEFGVGCVFFGVVGWWFGVGELVVLCVGCIGIVLGDCVEDVYCVFILFDFLLGFEYVVLIVC